MHPFSAKRFLSGDRPFCFDVGVALCFFTFLVPGAQPENPLKEITWQKIAHQGLPRYVVTGDAVLQTIIDSTYKAI
eukprot:8587025-Heterocapsa_arctica.AAC.1